jgi:hypothetical protein
VGASEESVVKVLDPGHRYELPHVDGDGTTVLTFVKRDGEGYPGNQGHHEGVIMQEVLRALIDRATYVDQQIPCVDTEAAIKAMMLACFLLERRAAVRRGRRTPVLDEAVYGVPHKGCGHVGCKGECGRA